MARTHLRAVLVIVIALLLALPVPGLAETDSDRDNPAVGKRLADLAAEVARLATALAGEAAARARGDADTLAQAKDYADSQDGSTLSAWKAYADSHDAATLSAANTYADSQDAATLSAANAYTDEQLALVSTGATVRRFRDDAYLTVTNSPSAKTTIATLSLPAGTYLVFAKAVLQNQAFATDFSYEADRTTTCVLGTAGATDPDRASVETTGPTMVVLNQLAVLVLAADANVSWDCDTIGGPAGNSSTRVSNRHVVALRVSLAP